MTRVNRLIDMMSIRIINGDSCRLQDQQLLEEIWERLPLSDRVYCAKEIDARARSSEMLDDVSRMTWIVAAGILRVKEKENCR